MTDTGSLEFAVRKFIVEEMLQGAESDALGNDTQLVEGGIVDSINVLKLVDFVEEGYGIELEPNDIRRFVTISSIAEVVRLKISGQG